MSSAGEHETGMYCLGCRYNLRGLPENRCPECGRSFDPSRPTTFARQQHPTPLRDLAQAFLKGVEQGSPDSTLLLLRQLRRQRSERLRKALESQEMQSLRGENELLRSKLREVLELMLAHDLIDRDGIERIFAEIEQAAAIPVELVDAEAGDDSEPSADLLDLQKAVEEASKHEP
jgi:hypothetical protein